jgi:FKBP-type peptidyl-prolyl cis-trans isomerase
MENKTALVTIFLVALAVGGGIYTLSTRSQNESQVLTNPSLDSVSGSNTGSTTGQTASDSPKLDTVEELKIEDIKTGTGAEAKAGNSVTVHYTGTLTDGTKFDSSLDRSEPFTFNLGAGDVIAGWDQGVAGMKVGGKRKLTIPSSMAYGDSGVPGAIPGGATLVFDVELLKVE